MSKVTHLKWDVLVGVDPTVGLTTGDLVSEWVHHPDGFVGYDLVWTDTTEGEIVVELSNNGSTVIKSMAYNDADWKLQLTNPAGADGAGKCELYTTASYSRVKYNVTAGTGQLTGTVTSKPLALGIVDIPVPLNLGGTEATTAAGARTSLQTGPAGAFGAVPAFVANAASIAPGTDKYSIYNIEAARTIAAASALTITTTDTPVVGNKVIACYALALGYAISVVNGGPLAGTIATFPASLTKPLGAVVYWDGTNYKFNGYVELLP